MTNDTLKWIGLEDLEPSPTNPRKTFDPAKLDELAASIATKGMIEPIVVRQHPKDAKRFEIVAGERRYRASVIGEVDPVPCIVRDLTAVEVLEIQTIENLQRDDLHPLEEAQGFVDLMKKASYDVPSIAAAISRSEKYVYDRIKLLALVPALQKVFLAGEITAGHAVILARLQPSDQKRASSNDYLGLWLPEHTDRNHRGTGRKAVSVRELQTWVDREVRFDPRVEDLPNLFPETEVAIQEAAEAELKVVHITREYRVPDAAKDSGTRTYGNAHWKRADGEKWNGPGGYGKERKSTTCEHSRLGLVVVGPGRGEAFLVCVDNKKCEAHWKEEMAEAKRRKKAREAGTDDSSRYAKEEARRRAKHEAEDLERQRFQKAAPELLKAAKTAVGKVTVGELMAIILRDVEPPKGWKKPKTAKDALQLLAYQEIERNVTWRWHAPQRAPKILRMVGVKAAEIVNRIAPKPKAEKKAPAKKKAKGKKK